MWMLACLSRTILWYCRLIYLLDNYNSTALVLASGYSFLPVYSKEELWNMPSKCSTARVCNVIPEIYQKPLKYRHLHIADTQSGPHGVRSRGVPVNRNMEFVNSVFIQMVSLTNFYFHFGWWLPFNIKTFDGLLYELYTFGGTFTFSCFGQSHTENTVFYRIELSMKIK